jgi:hypothetical protein
MSEEGEIALTGSMASAEYLIRALLAQVDYTTSRNGDDLPSKVQTTIHEVRIMGNPAKQPKPVIVKLIKNLRDNTGTIKVEHGPEFLEWQLTAKSLCHCCQRNLSHTNVLACAEWLGPNDHKKLCEGYKFSQRKYDEYLARVKK